MRKNNYVFQMHSTYAYYCWGESLQASCLVLIAETTKVFKQHIGHIQPTMVLFFRFSNMFHFQPYLLSFIAESLFFCVIVLKYISLCATWQDIYTTGATIMVDLKMVLKKKVSCNGLERNNICFIWWSCKVGVGTQFKQVFVDGNTQLLAAVWLVDTKMLVTQEYLIGYWCVTCICSW